MKTTINQEYRRIRKNLLARVRRLEKKGYILTGYVPAIPKRITKGSISRLQKLNVKQLYTKATMFVDSSSGEILSAKEGHKQLKRSSSFKKELQKAMQQDREALTARIERKVNVQIKDDDINKNLSIPLAADVVIENFIDLVNSYVYGQDFSRRDIFLRWIDEKISEKGREAVAKSIQLASQNTQMLSFEDAYDYINVMSLITNLNSYLEMSDEYVNEVLSEISVNEDT